MRKVLNEHISRWKHVKDKGQININTNPYQTEQKWKAMDDKLKETFKDYDPVAAEALIEQTLLKVKEMEQQKKDQEISSQLSIDVKGPAAPTVPPVEAPAQSVPNPPINNV